MNSLYYFFDLRKERDSNPRNIAVQRFSRPPQSTTLPSFLVRYHKGNPFFGFTKKIPLLSRGIKACATCGETGIRTLDTRRYNGFRDRPDRPLRHLSNRVAKRVISLSACKCTNKFQFPKFKAQKIDFSTPFCYLYTNY